MSTHLADAGQAGNVPQADLPVDRTNEAVGLKAYLDGVAAQVKTVPAAWVRCELLTLKPANKFVRMEFVEHDATGKKVAQVNGGCWPGVYRRVTEAFAAVGLRLEPGAKVLVKITSRLDANYGYSVEIEDIDPSYSVRPEGANHQWRKISPGELSIASVADERLGRVTDLVEAS